MGRAKTAVGVWVLAGLFGCNALAGINEPIDHARHAFGSSDALLVTEGGKPIAVVTRHDLLAFLSE